MKRILTGIAGILLILSSCFGKSGSDKNGSIVIDANQEGTFVPSSLFGIFFEEINHAGDGGLYAELVRNRSFEDLEVPKGYRIEGDKIIPREAINHLSGKIFTRQFPWSKSPVPSWSIDVQDASSARMELTKENPNFNTAPNNLKITIEKAIKPIRLINEGYWGMGVNKDEQYNLRIIARLSNDYKGTIVAKLTSEEGDELAASPVGITHGNEWQDLRLTLMPSAKDKKARLILEFNGAGIIWVDYVSLFPNNTFKNRENGLRQDLTQMVVNLNPAFVRWPGGSIVGGITLENRYDWKKTLGDPASRPSEYFTWGYQTTYGFGYFEFLQFCEDLGSKAMYVCNAGIACQFRSGEASPDNEIQFYIDDCMDAIEYAIGDINTKWGARRATDGHPDPFPLQYVEIGNENWGPEYDRRYNMFYKTIKEKYPQITLISNHAIKGTGHVTKTDMIDPHWYGSPGFFFQNSDLFDDYPRGKYTIYVGEYACNFGVGKGNMTAALAEAAFLTGIERNSDLVTMTSYAPLFQNRRISNWSVNLIWFDNDEVVGRSSYYVQKMAAENMPDYNVKYEYSGGPHQTEYKSGKIGFGSSKTALEFKDVHITEKGKRFPVDLNKCSSKKGEWEVESDVLKQMSPTGSSQYVLEDIYGNDFTLEFKARKATYDEGFFLYFGIGEEQSGYLYNIGCWNSEIISIEQLSPNHNFGAFGQSAEYSIVPNKWYDIKLVITPNKSELYIDGEKILVNQPKTVPTQFIACGVDKDTNELILKVVNSSNAAYKPDIKIKGTQNIRSTGKVISLSATNGREENSFEEPRKIYPQESNFNKFGKSFEYEFAPYSFTILRMSLK